MGQDASPATVRSFLFESNKATVGNSFFKKENLRVGSQRSEKLWWHKGTSLCIQMKFLRVITLDLQPNPIRMFIHPSRHSLQSPCPAPCAVGILWYNALQSCPASGGNLSHCTTVGPEHKAATGLGMLQSHCFLMEQLQPPGTEVCWHNRTSPEQHS